MRIQSFNVPVDIQAEILSFDWGTNCRVYPEKLQACSPFRDDSTPSFVVYFDWGGWADMGNARPGYEKGDFVTLLAYLRGTDRENTKRYLIRKYLAVEPDGLTLDLKLSLEPPACAVLDAAMLDNIGPSDYLARRGIDADTQRRYRAGYHAFKRAAVLPWFDRSGQLVAVKYRAVDTKKFWFARGGQTMALHLFGIRQTWDAEELFVTEAEIDALYLAANGYAAVALGTAHMSVEQEKMLIGHPAKRLIIATDADAPGRKCAEYMARRLGGYKDIAVFQHPAGCKDVNDVPQAELTGCHSGGTSPFSLEYTQKDGITI